METVLHTNAHCNLKNVNSVCAVQGSPFITLTNSESSWHNCCGVYSALS